VAGYHPVAGDPPGFWRPHRRGCPTPHYSAAAGKALPAIPLGIIARIGSVGVQRFGLLRGLVRADLKDPSPSAHRRVLLERAVELQQPSDVLVTDREFTVGQLQAAGATAWVTRLLKNMTARRANPPVYAGRGRPAKYGGLVRPLARRRAGREIAATAPDHATSWTERDRDGERILRAEQWTGLVLPDAAPGSPTFTVVAISDPAYTEPLLVATPLELTRPLAGRATAARRQADAGCGAPVRPRAGDLPTLSRTGAPGWGGLDLRRRDQPGRPDRLLGPPAPTYAGATPTPARAGRFSTRLPLAGTTSRETRGHRPPTEGVLGSTAPSFAHCRLFEHV